MRPIWCLLFIACAAAGTADELSGGSRRAEVTARRATRALAAPTVASDMAQRLERARLIRILGTDWDEVALATPDGAALETVLSRHGGSWRAKGAGKDVIRCPSSRDKFDWFLELRADGLVAEVQANWRVRHPGCRQMSIDVLESGVGLTDLSTQDALELSQAQPLSTEGVVVAIVDSGVAATTELRPRLVPGIDVLRPGNSETSSADRPAFSPSDSEAWDANGHGTAMASLVSALAPGAAIMPVRVVGSDCEGSVFDLAQGIRAAAAAGARIISVSLSLQKDSPLLRQAVAEAIDAGALVVAATGNDGVVEYPAALPGVLAVTAVDAEGRLPDFAPRGARVDIAAPGVAVVSVLPDETAAALTGTSPATAVVAAAAAGAAASAPGAGSEALHALVTVAVRDGLPVGDSTDGINGGVLDMTRLPTP